MGTYVGDYTQHAHLVCLPIREARLGMHEILNARVYILKLQFVCLLLTCTDAQIAPFGRFSLLVAVIFWY